MTWEKHFMAEAALWASRSKDPSSQVGCAIIGPDREVLSIGYNGPPRGVKDKPERFERPGKYLWTVHAEANAIANAARVGARLKGATAYVTLPPCAQCAGLLINAGIASVVVRAADDGQKARWGDSFTAAEAMLEEAGVVVSYLEETDDD